MLLRRKSYGPNRSEMRPQWFVRPPNMRVRYQSNSSPGAVVYGSPSSDQPPPPPGAVLLGPPPGDRPPSPASNSPNCRSGMSAPRRGESYDHANILDSFTGSQ